MKNSYFFLKTFFICFFIHVTLSHIMAVNVSFHRDRNRVKLAVWNKFFLEILKYIFICLRWCQRSYKEFLMQWYSLVKIEYWSARKICEITTVTTSDVQQRRLRVITGTRRFNGEYSLLYRYFAAQSSFFLICENIFI